MPMENFNVLRQRLKFYFLLIFVSLCICSCYKVERNCLDFHTGEFEFSTIVNGTMKTSYFIRTEKLEIETYEENVDSASIRWVNDCECILTKLNPVSNQDKRPIQIKIISTEKDSYVFEYSLVGDLKNIRRGKIIKIK